jgi:hypothetical protein
MVDVLVRNEGSVVIVTPQTDAAKEWVEENVETSGWQWLGGGFAVEPRMLDNLLEGMDADGLELELIDFGLEIG